MTADADERGGVRRHAPPVVLAHDYLTQRGGAERVALHLAREFPEATVITTVYDPDHTYPDFSFHSVQASWLSRIPAFRRDPRIAFLLLAPVVSRMSVPPGVLLASSSGWMHGLRARGPRIVYCHNTPRWLYQPDDYFASLPRPVRLAISALLRPLLAWDQRAAADVDLYLANSTIVAQRLYSSYGVRARVIHPPPGLLPDGPWEAVDGLKPGFFLTVGRRRGYKNTALVCEGVERVPGARLVVVGGLPPRRKGPWSDRLRGVSGISDGQLRWLYGNCSAVVAMSHEDFGMTPVEGFGFGKPAVTLRKGGFLDSCSEGVTGLFVPEESPESLASVLASFDPDAFPPDPIREQAQRFSAARFSQEIHRAVHAFSR